jgi:hypothetical protein
MLIVIQKFIEYKGNFIETFLNKKVCSYCSLMMHRCDKAWFYPLLCEIGERGGFEKYVE